MITLDDVTVQYDQLTAVKEITLTVERGEFVTIIGPSGCGKTTILRTIGGLEEPTTGTALVGGRPPERAQSEANIGYVFQRHTLFPWKSALDNVTFLRKMAGQSADEAEALSLLDTMGLDGFEDAKPAALSGGMKQRVAIARGLHLGADVLLMDEPFGELDEITRDRLSIELADVVRQEEKTVVFITHSVPEAVFLADRCLIMSDDPGEIREEIAVDLPRPRDEDVYESDAFHELVADVRRVIHGNTNR
jgi:NitT/TauT family transport system ATP-binding protein